MTGFLRLRKRQHELPGVGRAATASGPGRHDNEPNPKRLDPGVEDRPQGYPAPPFLAFSGAPVRPLDLAAIAEVHSGPLVYSELGKAEAAPPVPELGDQFIRIRSNNGRGHPVPVSSFFHKVPPAAPICKEMA